MSTSSESDNGFVSRFFERVNGEGNWALLDGVQASEEANVTSTVKISAKCRDSF